MNQEGGFFLLQTDAEIGVTFLICSFGARYCYNSSHESKKSLKTEGPSIRGQKFART